MQEHEGRKWSARSEFMVTTKADTLELQMGTRFKCPRVAWANGLWKKDSIHKEVGRGVSVEIIVQILKLLAAREMKCRGKKQWRPEGIERKQAAERVLQTDSEPVQN